MASREQILSVPCPTCKMPADSDCVRPDGGDVNGYHNTRIYRFEVVSEAIAHNEGAMTEIELRQPTTAVVPLKETGGTDLRLWAEQATAAAVYAEAICRTSMVPSAYKGKPEEATAAILAGAELGLSPMASLRAFHNISGTPTPSAMTIRAVVLAAGHQVEIVESTDQRAVVRGLRKGSDEWQTSVWDVPRAEALAQWKTNAMYRTNRAQMLAARATAEVCRWIGADALTGMPYAAEEIGDLPDRAGAPSARRLTVADLDVTSGPVGGEDPPVPAVTDQQRKKMSALWRDLGYDGDANRVQRLQIMAKILGVDELRSSSELNADLADRVIAVLLDRKAAMQAEGGAQ